MSDQSKTGPKQHTKSRAAASRRRFLQDSAAAAVVTGVAPHLLFGKSASAASRTLKIGFIGPRTGALARLGESNDFDLAGIRKAIASGITINGATYPVEILEKDSQSDQKHAAEIASELIKLDRVDLMVASSTGATVNPVSNQCETNSVPCITTDAPWQSYFFGRSGAPEKGFDWTYHFFWGLEDLIAVFTAMWSSIPTNKVVGALWPSDPEGIAYSDAKFGFPPALQTKGFKLVDPGRFENSAADYSAHIAAFKKANVEILSGVLPPPAFATFWKQAGEQGFKPKPPPLGGQWIPGSQSKGSGGQHIKNALVIVNNEHDPPIGPQRKMEPLS